MKWYKHPSDLSRDEGVRAYLDEFKRDRFAAYGFLVRVLEIIAERMSAKEGSLKCYVTYSITEWARLLECHRNAVDKYLPNLGTIGWVSVTFDEGYRRVHVPKMVEWRDETTRKSGAVPERFAQNRAEQSRKDQRESREGGSLSEGKTRKATEPETFVVTPELEEWARTTCPGVDIESETAKFNTRRFDPSKHNSRTDAWKQWMLRAKEHAAKNPSAPCLSAKDQTKAEAEKLGLTQEPHEANDAFERRVGVAMTVEKYGMSH